MTFQQLALFFFVINIQLEVRRKNYLLKQLCQLVTNLLLFC